MISRRGLFSLPLLALVPRSGERRQSEHPTPLPETRLLFGGDVMLARGVALVANARGDPAGPLREIAPLLSAADIAFVNLESPFSDKPAIFPHHMIFRAAPQMIGALKLAGITVVSIANNHIRDCGPYGIEFTLRLLRQNGIAAVGAGLDSDSAHRGAVIVRNGVRFGFLGYTFDQANGNHKDYDDRIAMLDVKRAAFDVSALKSRADVVIVSMHAGVEYRPQPEVSQRNFARAVIEAGASIVVGHHPHVVQAAEQIGSAVAFYSLGNLVFDQFQREDTQAGEIAEVVFCGRRLVRYSLLPVRILPTGPRLITEARTTHASA
jgi:poly-gamma-glutamate capsule biosynthesis protein CapA/YwtB (metallophosphatase superfamily)